MYFSISDIQVKVELKYSREALRIYYFLRNVAKCLRYVAAGFLKGHLGESTPCSPFPAIPGYRDLCNFTDLTPFGSPWYCGKPRKLGLTCTDWQMIRDMEFIEPLPLSSAETRLVAQLGQPPQIRAIPSLIGVKALRGTPKLPTRPCARQNFSSTWKLDKPRGYFLHRKWFRTDCRQSTHTPLTDMACLTNTTIIFAGDSNIMNWFHLLETRLHCRLILDHGHTWHKRRSCVKEDINFHMTWTLHGFPNHPVSDHWAPRSDFKDVTEQINGVPSNGRTVVVVHLFVHYSIHHYSVLHRKMEGIRRATIALLERNPEAVVVIKGPHTAVAKQWSAIHLSDMAGQLMREIIHRVFKDLHSRVLYLDYWDMTIAAENPTVHPQDFVNMAMLDVFLDHICHI